MKKDFIINEEKPIAILADGRIVVEEKVDKDNKLLYVIKDGENFVIESAMNQPISEIISTKHIRTKTTTYVNGEIVSVEET